MYQGQRKPFISGQDKVGSEHHSVECVDNVSLISLNITKSFCLLLSFLHDRIPCKDNAWAPDNLEPLDIFSIYYHNKPNKSKNQTNTIVFYLLRVKMDFNFLP